MGEVMVTARSSTSIAVIKDWGKRDDSLILPINDSISVTLHPDHLSITTTVAVSPSFASDCMWLNGKEISLEGDRYQSCLREIRSRGGRLCAYEEGHLDWERGLGKVASLYCLLQQLPERCWPRFFRSRVCMSWIRTDVVLWYLHIGLGPCYDK